MISTLDGILNSKYPKTNKQDAVAYWAGMKMRNGAIDQFGKKKD